MALGCLALCSTVNAQDNELYIEPVSGDLVKWEVASLQKMVFQNGNIVLTMKDGTSTYTPISSVSRMYFRKSATGIDAVVGGMKEYVWDGSVLRVDGCQGGQVKVYAVNGVLVMQSVVDNDGAVNLSELQSGMYIVNVNGVNLKIAK